VTRNIAHPAISTIDDLARQNRRAVTILALAAAAFMALPVAATADVSTEEKARIAPITAPFDMPQLQRPVFPDRSFNLTNYGAFGNGTTKNTEAFRRAITACNAAGGGRVVVPAGKWFTGPIHLKSLVNLHLEEGAEIHFSDDPQDYLPPVFIRYQGLECMNYSPLIYARDCINIAITGRGSVHGHGQKWWRWSTRAPGTGSEALTGKRLDKMIVAKLPVAERIMPSGEQAGFRPQFIQPINCTNVLLEDFTIAAPGPFWTVQFVYCENVIARALNIQTKGGPNTDGIDLDSTRNALIEDNLVNAGDDCICLKSGRDTDGRRVGRPCENIVVRNCKTLSGHGGVVIGSETSGDVRNVWAHDCDFSGTDIGIRIKTMRGRGGVVENLHFENLTMNGVRHGIHVTTFYHPTPEEPVSERTPTFRNLHMRNITAHNVKQGTISVTGLPERPVSGLVLENLTMEGATGGEFTDAENVKLVNVRLTPASGPVFSMKNVADVSVEKSPSPKGESLFLNVKGKRTRNIRLQACDYSGAEQGITFGEDVPSETKANFAAP
jgi:polygalacturonase